MSQRKLQEIIIADDNVTNRRILLDMLKSEYTVLEARDGTTIINLMRAKKGSLRVVLLSLGIAGGRGAELLEQIQSDESISGIPIVFLSQKAEDMYECALLARYYGKDFSDWPADAGDETIRKRIIMEQDLLHDITNALKEEQFEIWFQPQYNHMNGTLIGAEALARWRHPKKGLISPILFIPLLEKTNFIYEVDKYVWKHVCESIRKWLDEDYLPIPVSMNVSKYDMDHEDMLDTIIQYAKDSNIKPELLPLEISESALTKMDSKVLQVVKKCQGNGFPITIDDYGSGSSSMYILKEVPANCVKLDIRTLEAEASSRGGNILESVVRMVKWLGMSVIAEGIEKIEQADYLKTIGCNYVQGYLYAMPMPKEEYEKLALNHNVEERKLSLDTITNLDNNAFWNPDSMDTLLFNSYMGAACVFEYHKGKIELLRANKKYMQIISRAGMSIDEALKLNWVDYFDENTRTKVKSKLMDSLRLEEEVSSEFVFHGVPGCDRDICLKASLRVIATMNDRYLVYCLVENMTAQREAEKKLEKKADQLSFLNDTAKELLGQEDTTTGIRNLLQKTVKYFEADRAFLYEYCWEDHTCIHTMEIDKNLHTVMNMPDKMSLDSAWFWLRNYEKSRFLWIEDTRLIADTRPDEYSMYEKIDGHSVLAVSVLSKKKVIGTMGIVNPKRSYKDYDDLSALGDYAAVLLKRRDLNAKIRFSNESLMSLMKDTPGGFVRMHICQDGNIRTDYVNQVYCELRGMTMYEIMETDRENAMYSIHPDDLELIRTTIAGMIISGESRNIRYRLRNKKGEYVWYRVFGRLTQDEDGERYLNVYYMDLSDEERKELSIQESMPFILAAIMEASPDLTYAKDANYKYICCSKNYARIAGLKDEKEIVGKSDYDLFDKVTADRYRADDNKLINSRESIIDSIEQLPTRDGITHYSSTSKYIICDRKGRVIGMYGIGMDITEYRTAYEQLQLLTENIPGGLAMIEMGTIGMSMLYYNEGFYQFSGYSRKDYQKKIKEDPMFLIYKEDRRRVREALSFLLKDTTRTVDCTYRCHTSKSGFRWFNMRGRVSEVRQNSLIVNIVQFDITAQKLSEEARLKQAEKTKQRYEYEMQLRHEMIRDSIIYYQMNLTNGKIDEYLSRIEDVPSMRDGAPITHTMREEILRSVVPEDQKKVSSMLFSKELKRAYENGETDRTIEYRRRVLKGVLHWVRARVTIMKRPDAEEIIAFIYIRDIDVEKKDQMAVSTIMDEEIESVVLIDVDSGNAHLVHSKLVFSDLVIGEEFNFDAQFAKMNRIFVVKEELESSNQFFSISDITYHLNKEKVYSYNYQVQEQGVLRRKLSKAYYLDDNKREVVLTRRDITGLYEEEMRQKGLLQKAVAEAKEASHAKSDFLSNMSHDMRTPLNAVLAFSNDEITGEATESQLRDYLDKIHYSGDYLLGIINDVLDMSKIEQKKIVLNPEAYEFDQFIKIIQNIIGELSKTKQVNFNINADKINIPAIVVDKVRFNQIFINLLSNAVKFTSPGGIVELIAENTKHEDKEYLCFIVRDNGIGMTPEFLPHAFESFKQEYRKDSTAKTPGTGLGLAIVKELVELMHGTIKVESTLGKGTTFTVEMPVIEASVEKNENVTVETGYEKLNGMHVLLAEDNEINTEIVTMLLEKQKCVLDCVDDGKKALEKFLDSPIGYYEVILMDLRMPVMGGLESAKAIRESERRDARKVPIVALTADVYAEDHKEATGIGMNALLSKPIVPKKLFDTLVKIRSGAL